MYVAAKDKSELLATMLAYAKLMRAGWPEVHPDLAKRTLSWSSMDAGALAAELSRLLDETGTRGELRVFWKLVPGYAFRGGNAAFVKDSTLPSLEAVLGQDDFSPKVPWNRQAAHYRKDDEEVVNNKRDKLNIVERQDQADGTTWLQTSKTPIVDTSGKVIGLLGAYQVIDGTKAARLMKESGR